MHTWGDKDVDWKGISDAAEFIYNECKAAGMEGYGFKEKWGQPRVGVFVEDDSQKCAYHKAYAEAVERWPHLYREILDGANFHEYLVGIINPEDCEHSWWSSEQRVFCSICGINKEDV